MNKHDRWLEAPYDEAAERGHRFEKLREKYTAEAERDCTDAVLAASEERVTSALIAIGNFARKTRADGDVDDKIEFINWACLRIDLIINDYAKAQAEKNMDNENE